MIIEKPLWVCHKGEHGKLTTIYSVDVHPDGTRIATGGGDDNARIWAMEPIVDKEAEATPTKHPRQLAVCTGHSRAVTSVRWSCNGLFLACGSDDTSVSLWTRFDENERGGENQMGGRQTEEWSRILTCRGHASDVQDVAWSPDDTKLASCSVDNTVMVWAITAQTIRKIALNQPIAKLTEHRGWVKGLAWDPIGKYLASMGDDHVLNVWRTSDWKIEKQITEGFQGAKGGGMSTVRRISWSPDGSAISGTQAYKEPRHCAILVQRNTWETGTDLVGHTCPVVASRFNPRMMIKEGEGPKALAKIAAAEAAAEEAAKKTEESEAAADGKKKKRKRRKKKKSLQSISACCTAIGDQRGTISIWLSTAGRPVVALKNALSNAVTDLSWSDEDGRTLVASSFDGEILVVRFSEEELGEVLSKERHVDLLKEMYGGGQFDAAAALLVENTGQLALENGLGDLGATEIVPVNRKIHQHDVPSDQPTMTMKEATAYQKTDGVSGNAVTTREGIMLQSFKGTNSPVKKKQKMTVTNTGKKRICPVLIVSQFPSDNSNSGCGGASGGQSAKLSNQVVTINSLMRNAAVKSVGRSGTTKGAPSSPNSKVFVAPTRKRSGSARKKDRRTSTTVASNPESDNAVTGTHPLLPHAINSVSLDPMVYAFARRAFPLDKPPRRAGHSIMTGSSVAFLSPVGDEAQAGGGDGSVGRRRVRLPTTLEFKVMTTAARDQAASGHLDIATVARDVAAASSASPNGTPAEIAPPAITESNENEGVAQDPGKILPEVVNTLEEDCLATTVLTSSCNGKIRWRDDVRGRGSLIAGNDTFAALALTSGELLLYTNAGRRRTVGVVLPAPLAFLECVAESEMLDEEAVKQPSVDASILLGICCNGEMRIWDACAPRMLVYDQHGVSRLLSMVARELETKLHYKIRQTAVRNGEVPGPATNVRVTPIISKVFLKPGVSHPSPIVVVEASSQTHPNTRLVQAFVYSFQMQSWSRIADDRYTQSDFFSLFAQGTSDGVGPLASVQAACANAGSYDLTPTNMFGNGVEGARALWTESRAHLEHQISSALLLGSGEEYKSWLMAYSKFLADDGLPESCDRLNEICSELLGPTVPHSGWSESILGIQKLDLLKRVLRYMSSNRQLQRAVNEFNEQIIEREKERMMQRGHE